MRNIKIVEKNVFFKIVYKSILLKHSLTFFQKKKKLKGNMGK